MKENLSLLGLSVLLLFGAACGAARRSASTAQDATVAAGREVGDKAEDAAEATAEKSKELARTVDDATITSAVKMRFAKDETVKAFAINVDTKNGEVTLTGTVKSQAEANRAIELARGIEGVKNVTSNLTIKK